jgi:hypothetical protein
MVRFGEHLVQGDWLGTIRKINCLIDLIDLLASKSKASGGNGIEKLEKVNMELGRDGGKCRISWSVVSFALVMV